MMLRRNYRSHDQILLLPSRMFYFGKLIPCADVTETATLGHWSRLPAASSSDDVFPLLFVGVDGQQQAINDADALTNQAEVVLSSLFKSSTKSK